MYEIQQILPQQGVKFSHKKWKALLKKQKRRIKRKNEAKVREQIVQKEQEKKEQSPSYQAKELEQRKLEQLEKQRENAEKAYLNKVWMEKERLAQEEFKRKKEWEEKEKIRREVVEKKIKEEWEETQKKEQEEKEKQKKKKKHQDSLLQQATANENKDGEEPWHNPIASLLPGKEKETCPFFAKTGVCRFGDRCSRGHPQPDMSTTMLIKGMYSHFELEQGLLDENDSDLILEYEDSELYNNFRDFYDDIVPEFKALGRVIQVKVCCNYEPHLRGNVYVQYSSEEEAHSAMVKMNGRFYGGKQISCEPVDIKSWKSAICGLFGRGRCPKGRNCNFLHVFKNPRNEFWGYDKMTNVQSNRGDQSRRSQRYSRSRSRSPYSKRSHRRHSYSRNRDSDYRSKTKYRSRSHRYSRSRSRDRYSRSRSKERNSRSVSRSRRYSKSRSRSRSQSRRKLSELSSKSKKRSYSRSRSKETRSYSRSRSKERSRSHSRKKSNSESPSRHRSKKKKHKTKKHKKSSSNKDKHVFNGDSNNGNVSHNDETQQPDNALSLCQ